MSSTLGEKLGLTSSSTWDNVITSITNATVSTVLSFSLASTAYNSITFTWKNPASGGFAGVVIVGKTGSYPSSPTDGTTYYTGLGNNSSANGTSSITLTSFSGGTTYYFRCWSYVLINNVKWYSDYKQTTITTAVQKGQQIFTASGTFTVPANVTSIDIFCVGGGGGGASDTTVGSGGGGGYTTTKLKQTVTPGASYTVTIGAGGNTEISKSGGYTSFGTIITAYGGYTGAHDKDGYVAPGRGGCGGSGGNSGSSSSGYPASGGSNGSDEIRKSGNTIYGKGQGTTTKAFAESSNTLYAGGGGAYYYTGNYAVGTPGGDGGGGGGFGYDIYVAHAYAGTANTGGGGGGGSTKSSDKGPSGAGGSGICIVRWGY